MTKYLPAAPLRKTLALLALAALTSPGWAQDVGLSTRTHAIAWTLDFDNQPVEAFDYSDSATTAGLGNDYSTSIGDAINGTHASCQAGGSLGWITASSSASYPAHGSYDFSLYAKCIAEVHSRDRILASAPGVPAGTMMKYTVTVDTNAYSNVIDPSLTPDAVVARLLVTVANDKHKADASINNTDASVEPLRLKRTFQVPAGSYFDIDAMLKTKAKSFAGEGASGASATADYARVRVRSETPNANITGVSGHSYR
ncbi:hypothetical protein LRH25_32070 [Ideonella azotifigens]|uniref:Uncharacterized protein n=1 Tax=Ideonella azotifigens TaxID=513160 RepID=A0ABN1K0F7_9BURK|nr:hypothetical protein [Ideonella azotifigens]MCD2344963.1 hypothetical protein [Ideonella azotifigens]